MKAPLGKSPISNTLTGEAVLNANVTYLSLPVVGFAAQSYSTNGLPGVNPNVLSNCSGSFVRKITRRIEISR